VPTQDAALIALLEDIFVVVALLTIGVGLILPGMIAHAAVEVSKAADLLVTGTLAEFTKAMRALAAGDLARARTRFSPVAVKVFSHDEVGDMALSFNRLQLEIGRAADGLDGAREGLFRARSDLIESNKRLRQELAERRHAEEALQISLGEKEALLSEVHHRVKNNLQIINSLLRLECGRSDAPATQATLKDMQDRIHAMALLHESLCHSGTFAAVDLGVYLEQLSTQSFQVVAGRPNSIRLQLDLASVQIGMDQAVPCGLLANELISNCLKHGFCGDQGGEVRVELLALDGGPQWCLRVSDTGVGLPPDFLVKRGHSLGLRLVASLASQMQGKLEIGPGPVAIFTVIFTPDVRGLHA
jgi:two-component sensor histidine kinase/HAMP domain-containing protein